MNNVNITIAAQTNQHLHLTFDSPERALQILDAATKMVAALSTPDLAAQPEPVWIPVMDILAAIDKIDRGDIWRRALRENWRGHVTDGKVEYRLDDLPSDWVAALWEAGENPKTSQWSNVWIRAAEIREALEIGFAELAQRAEQGFWPSRVREGLVEYPLSALPWEWVERLWGKVELKSELKSEPKSEPKSELGKGKTIG